MVLSYVLSCVIMNDELYCVDGRIGCLYRITLKNWEIESLGKLEFEWNNSKVTDVFLYQDDIWCIPLYANQIAKYHRDSGKITYFKSDYQNEGRLYTILRDGVFYMIPLKPVDRLLEFHIKNKRFRINHSWDKKLRQKNKENERFLMAAYDGDIVIITQKSTKEVLQIDFRNFEMKKHILPVSDNLFGIVWMNGCFYFTAEKNKKIIVWNQKENTIEEYTGGKLKDDFYLRPVALSDRLLLTDGKCQYYFKDGKFWGSQDIDQLENIDENTSYFFRMYQWNGKILLPPCSANMFLEVSASSYIVTGHIIELPLKDIWLSMDSHFQLDENEWSLENYLNMVTKNIIDGREKESMYGTIIYEEILGGEKE